MSAIEKIKQDFLVRLKATASEQEAATLHQSFSQQMQNAHLSSADKKSFDAFSKPKLEEHLIFIRESSSLTSDSDSASQHTDEEMHHRAVTFDGLMASFLLELEKLFMKNQMMKLMSSFHKKSKTLEKSDQSLFDSAAQLEINNRLSFLKKNPMIMPPKPISALSYLSHKLSQVVCEMETLYPLETDSLSTHSEKVNKFDALEKQYISICKQIYLNKYYKTANRQQDNNVYKLDQNMRHAYLTIISTIKDANKMFQSKLNSSDQSKYRLIRVKSTADTLMDEQQKDVRLNEIQYAVNCAATYYSAWNANKSSYARGAMGFFTHIRHGSKGLAVAASLKDAIAKAVTEEDAILQINTILRASNLNRHSFGSFLLDELVKLPQGNAALWKNSTAAHWAKIEPIKEGHHHNKYTQQQVSMVTEEMDKNISEKAQYSKRLL